MSLEKYFQKFRENTIGRDQYFEGPFGKKKIIYADWTASGRLYSPIEELLQKEVFPFVANTHTETNTTGATMNIALHKAMDVIKDSVGANNDDVIISAGAGMTMLVNKFQRILGLKIHEKYQDQIKIRNRPIVFVTHMEHHSNQTTWLETIAEVYLIPHNKEGKVDLVSFEKLISEYKYRETIITAVTSCSNVTGVFTPYHEIAEITHKYNGFCFVDFACSAPYIDINMHPEKDTQYLDAIYFKGIIEVIDELEGKEKGFSILLLGKNNIGEEVELGDFYTIRSAYDFVVEDLKKNSETDAEFLLLGIENSLKQNIKYNSSFRPRT